MIIELSDEEAKLLRRALAQSVRARLNMAVRIAAMNPLLGPLDCAPSNPLRERMEHDALMLKVIESKIYWSSLNK